MIDISKLPKYDSKSAQRLYEQLHYEQNNEDYSIDRMKALLALLRDVRAVALAHTMMPENMPAGEAWVWFGKQKHVVVRVSEDGEVTLQTIGAEPKPFEGLKYNANTTQMEGPVDERTGQPVPAVEHVIRECARAVGVLPTASGSSEDKQPRPPRR